MVVLAVALFAVTLQDLPVGPPPPPVPSQETTVQLPALGDPPPLPEKADAATKKTERRSFGAAADSRRREDRPLINRDSGGPNLGGFVVWTGVVMALMVGLFLLLRRFTRGSRFMAGAGAINVLARKPLSQRQEIFLVEVGTKVFMIGSTREQLSTLGEFSHPDEVAVLRANLPRRKEDKAPLVFRESLREGIRQEESPPAQGKVYDSIVGELAEIRKTVRAWRA